MVCGANSDKPEPRPQPQVPNRTNTSQHGRRLSSGVASIRNRGLENDCGDAGSRVESETPVREPRRP